MEDVIAMQWTDTSGSDRDLLKRILEQRADEVRVSSASLARLQRLERFGFPHAAAETRQRWVRPAASAKPDAAVLATLAERVPGVRVSDAGGALELDATTVAPEALQSLLAQIDGGDVAIIVDVRPELDGVLWRAGLEPTEVIHGCVLKPRLSQTRVPATEYAFRISHDEVEQFGQQSGDLNPLHFDDEFARAVGFQGRITHGMIFNSWLTRLLGQEYPGPGTIFLKSSMVFLAPIYPDAAHSVRISTPDYDAEKQLYRVVAQVLDASGQHCVIAYSDVVRRLVA